MTTAEAVGIHDLHRAGGHLTAELRLTARLLPTLSASQRERARRHVLRVLDDFEPQITANEELCPSIGYAIRDWIAQIETCNIDEPSYLQELLYGLDALIRVHVWEEQAAAV